MFQYFIIFSILIILGIYMYFKFFKIDYSKRISKVWIPWSNREPYDIYKRHNKIEESLNPNMDRIIVGPNDIELYLDSELLDLYKSSPLPIMKSDILRLGVIYNRGGWYCDMDVKPLIPWTKLMKNYDVILFAEDDNKQYWPCPKEDKTQTLRIAYDVFYIKAKDEFIKHVIKTLKSRCKDDEFLKATTKCDIFYYTGPDMFTHAYHTYHNKESIYIYYENDVKSKFDFGKKSDYGI